MKRSLLLINLCKSLLESGKKKSYQLEGRIIDDISKLEIRRLKSLVGKSKVRSLDWKKKRLLINKKEI